MKVITDLTRKKALPDIEEAQKKIRENKEAGQSKASDFNTFKKEILSLNNQEPLSIAFAENLVKGCLPVIDTPYRDSVFLYFNNIFYSVANTFSDSMFNKYPLVFEILAKDKSGNSPEVNSFKNYLSLFGMETADVGRNLLYRCKTSLFLQHFLKDRSVRHLKPTLK